MNRKVVFVTALVVVFVVMLAWAFNVMRVSQPKIGIYYYVWYGSGLGNRHWNDTQSSAVIDTPVLRFYDSNNLTVINQHMKWMEDLGIDFIIISWWGINSYEDNATKNVVNVIKSYNLQYCILIENYNQTGYYNWTNDYNYIYSNHVNNQYFKLDGKPLLLILETAFPEHGTKRPDIAQDPRFTIRLLGSHTWSDWYYGDVLSKVRLGDFSGRLNRDNHTNIFPRYDEYYLKRPNWTQYDPTYAEGLYDKFWDLCTRYAANGTLNIITITTWNEFHERTAIEPAFDNTSYRKDDPYFIYNKTKEYVAKLRNPITYFPTLVLFIATALGGAAVLTFNLRSKLSAKFRKISLILVLRKIWCERSKIWGITLAIMIANIIVTPYIFPAYELTKDVDWDSVQVNYYNLSEDPITRRILFILFTPFFYIVGLYDIWFNKGLTPYYARYGYFISVIGVITAVIASFVKLLIFKHKAKRMDVIEDSSTIINTEVDEYVM